ncbi:MAG: tryptophan-rich sensory protein [bacterium]|nr:MAG: tryptophan-rich sensory protein [bacterium]
MKSILGLVGWLFASFAAGWIGSRYMPGEWYASLAKPAWTPPDAIFAPVWTVLYVLMGVAAWLVWRRAGFSGAGAALVLFIIQLILNALWSYLFFGIHRADIAFFDIVVLWVVILAVVVLFWREDKRAGALMMPYLVWVGFASCLNFALWRLNVGPVA